MKLVQAVTLTDAISMAHTVMETDDNLVVRVYPQETGTGLWRVETLDVGGEE